MKGGAINRMRELACEKEGLGIEKWFYTLIGAVFIYEDGSWKIEIRKKVRKSVDVRGDVI